MHRRDLPWRRTRDPYSIWVSEIMLQQTRVETVVPYYTAFLERWPTIERLAAADREEVRASWSGLGYYRRAELLLSAAALVARDHGGQLPDDPAALSCLPGFGRYTVGAVASMAFDRALPAVDGNVSRVLARHLGLRGDPGASAVRKKIWAAAERLAEGPCPGELNQALIELGALVCTPRSPRCKDCPVRRDCVANARGEQALIPPPKKRKERPVVDKTAVVVMAPGARLLLEQQPSGGLFSGLWCPLLLDGHLEADGISDECERRYGLELGEIGPTSRFDHVLTHRLLRIQVASVHATKAQLESALEGSVASAAAPRLELVALDSLRARALPTLTVKSLEAALVALGRPLPAMRRRQPARTPGKRPPRDSVGGA